eukprot:gnl/TRDRNA2_/TRDRNA2_128463_c0_seq2.p1 gnl/TRDRNA2_/TRDRNA2_128463_c0~~gnl/TRDRNA2_/TRDRNA2_128463_c0_seq2.p1  ORF type:complete len:265 (-),score=35.48 gnl/TRDRNA2_/TRDRNA2_128463_c0_seq2:211-1005(-)
MGGTNRIPATEQERKKLKYKDYIAKDAGEGNTLYGDTSRILNDTAEGVLVWWQSVQFEDGFHTEWTEYLYPDESTDWHKVSVEPARKVCVQYYVATGQFSSKATRVCKAVEKVSRPVKPASEPTTEIKVSRVVGVGTLRPYEPPKVDTIVAEPEPEEDTGRARKMFDPFAELARKEMEMQKEESNRLLRAHQQRQWKNKQSSWRARMGKGRAPYHEFAANESVDYRLEHLIPALVAVTSLMICFPRCTSLMKPVLRWQVPLMGA